MKVGKKITGKLGIGFDTKKWWENDYRMLGKIGGKLVKKSIVLSQFINGFPSLMYKGRL